MTRLPALVTALLATLALLVSGALSAPPASAAPRQLTTDYTCTSSYGGGTSVVTIAVNLPAKARKGRKLKARPVSVSMTVPDAMVARMRQFNVTAVSAISPDATYRIGNRARQIGDFVLPRTAIPATGPVTLVGSGKAAGYRFKQKGKHPVRVPTAFSARATAYGTVLGDLTIEIKCALAAGSPEQIGVIKVRR